MSHSPEIDRRDLLVGTGAALICGSFPQSAANAAEDPFGRTVISIAQFGARVGSTDNTDAIQAAIREVERRGGGTVLIPGRYRCGNIVISGSMLRLLGQSGWLVDGRLTIAPSARNIQLVDLGLLETTGDRSRYLLDVSGQDCTFDHVQLVKDPIAGGVQMYVRQAAARCRFAGLRLKGSNGIILAGRDHSFDGFELESTMSKSVGGDDAFAIKAANALTENITIRNGTIRGFGSMVSFGSEIGTSRDGIGPGAVRNVTIENVKGDRCTRLVFFKPGGLDYDYNNGLVDQVVLRNLSLTDPTGQYFRTGIYMIAGRGAVIRNVRASAIQISARAMDRRVAPTSAVEITLLDKGAPARIENVSLQVKFTDPYAGAPHGAAAPGYPVDHIVEIEKRNPASGSMSNILLDVVGRGASIGGIHVGSGLNDAVKIARAVLTRVATDPPSSLGAGIWSDSRVSLGDVSVDSVELPKFGGKAFANGRR